MVFEATFLIFWVWDLEESLHGSPWNKEGRLWARAQSLNPRSTALLPSPYANLKPSHHMYNNQDRSTCGFCAFSAA